MKRVITFGTFDIFHIGHLNIIKRAAALGDELYVGVSTDNLNFNKKNHPTIFKEKERLEIIKNIKGVTEAFFEESLQLKRDYILKYKIDILVMGDDWKGKFDDLNNVCETVYLPRTKNISSTDIKEAVYSFMSEIKLC
jgi:glycerol-3-phosphate cytidylyltransferase